MAQEQRLTWQKITLFIAISALLLLASWSPSRHAIANQIHGSPGDGDIESWCPIPAKATAPRDGLEDSSVLFEPQQALQVQAERLAAAVNVSTISYDNNGDVDHDLRWETFSELHVVLKRLFPLIHLRLELEKVNKYGLLYHLAGTDRSLKPVLFMAHQDVVPASSSSTWKYPPFQAQFDGEWTWGRGAADCKSNLIGLMSAMESLLEQDFRPKRTIIFSFGFDEETGGFRGAAKLAEHLEQKLGSQSLAMILDEGGMGVSRLGEVAYALPAIAEKGFVDLIMTLEVNGGHASRPPPHSGIGIMSALIVALEHYSFTPVLNRQSPVRKVLECEAEYSPQNVEPWLRKKLKKGIDIGPEIAKSRKGNIRWQLQTSQAVDIIRGGDKDNQLPEAVVVTVNYRLAPHEDIDQLFLGLTKELATVAHKYNISVSGFGFHEARSANGILKLESKDLLLPSPIAPATADSSVWTIFAGTLRQVFESASTLSDVRQVVPVGSIATGNSDTAHYWNLTRNIFRFTPAREGSRLEVHTINERMEMSAHLEGVRVYYDLIRNVQAYEGDTCTRPYPSL